MSLQLNLKVKPLTSEFSVWGSIKAAIDQTMTQDYLQCVLVWGGIELALSLLPSFMFLSGLVGFMASAAISVSWFRFLAYREPMPRIRFKKPEAHYFLIWLVINTVLGFIIFAPIVLGSIFGMSFFPNHWGVATGILGAFGIIGAGFLVWIGQYVAVYLALLALGFSSSYHIKWTREIVDPIRESLWLGYLSIFLTQFFLSGILFLAAGPIGFLLSIPLNLFFTGVTLSFTSHVLYMRAEYQKPELAE